MTKMFKKLAAATVGAAICLVPLQAKMAQAAVFNFFSEGNGRLFGDLVFNDATSGLTGIGTEEASLSQLNANFGFYFDTTSSLLSSRTLSWGNSDLLSTPVFRFESGSLVGVSLNLPPKEVTWLNPGLGNGLWVETNQVFVQDATYRIKRSQVIKGGYNPFCNPYTYIPYPPYVIYQPEKCIFIGQIQGPTYETTGQINFVTRVPFKRPTSVPEPASVVGLSLLGLAFLLKQKTASSQG